MNKLAIITTHPIQYNAPLFKKMAMEGRFEVRVFYTWGSSILEDRFDPGFGKYFQWDIDLLEGYDSEFVKNISKEAGSHHYKGIVNPTLIDRIENWGATAVLIYGWKFDSHWKAMKYFYKRIPVFFRGDSTLLDDTSWYKDIVRRVTLRHVYSFVDYFLFTGQANKAYFKMANAKENQLIFAPHAIDLEFFKSENTSSQLRAELNIPDDHIVFLFAGKLEEKKNPLGLVEAFLNAGNASSHLIVAGEGSLRKEIERLQQGNANIHLLPFQNQSAMPKLYNAADVFVFPSNGPNETWGLAVNEAMSCGCAVLVSDKCGCAADMVIQGKNGFIFNSNNQLELEKKVHWFQNNKKELTSFSLQSISHTNQYNYSKMVEALNLKLVKNV